MFGLGLGLDLGLRPENAGLGLGLGLETSGLGLGLGLGLVPPGLVNITATKTNNEELSGKLAHTQTSCYGPHNCLQEAG